MERSFEYWGKGNDSKVFIIKAFVPRTYLLYLIDKYQLKVIELNHSVIQKKFRLDKSDPKENHHSVVAI